MLNISTRRVGGIRFVRIGMFCFSFCVSRKHARKVEPFTQAQLFAACRRVAAGH